MVSMHMVMRNSLCVCWCKKCFFLLFLVLGRGEGCASGALLVNWAQFMTKD